ncbi:LANO_0D00804g1_1 [Lachancea nothofagi CBS 11611]|uniref:LANO_0D00804g1_1 n=1 Tax=Lachancea nothofagi CBS 11611 TaxID=1266666 RepID=A0A1G4JCZ6_9SACH|nr:LANO_0D00804g1_1 [Lachancea nothofagi CBS 11611]
MRVSSYHQCSNLDFLIDLTMSPVFIQNQAKMAELDSTELVNAIVGGQSSDNTVREHCEAFIWQKMAESPGSGCTMLMELACRSESKLENRLYALLALRKLITMYWSAGFESYRGPPGVGEEGKVIIRDALLKLGLDDAQDSRVVASSSYCIVQIAAVDFPDDWPQLLETVFGAIINRQSLSALRVLNEVFDDVVSEEMFFQGGVGWKTLQLVTEILKSPNFSLQAKISAGKLYKTCLGQLQSRAATATKELRDSLKLHLRNAISIFLLIARSHSSLDPSDVDVPRMLQIAFQCLNTIKTSFTHKIVTENIDQEIKSLVIDILVSVAHIMEYNEVSADSDEFTAFDDLGCEVMQMLGNLHDTPLEEPELDIIVKSSIACSGLRKEEIEDWQSDFNTFASREEGLSGLFTMRDACEEYLTDAINSTQRAVTTRLLSHFSELKADDWRFQESILFLIRPICENEENHEINEGIQLLDLLMFVSQRMLAPGSNLHPLLLCRILIVVPRILDGFRSQIDDFENVVKSFLKATLPLALTTSTTVTKLAFLMSFTDYYRFCLLEPITGSDLDEIRCAVCQLIEEVSPDSEEDTVSVILEALTSVVSTKANDDKSSPFYHEALQLLLKISVKNPSDVQVVLEAQDCLSKLLTHVSTEVYVEYSKTCIPLFVNTLTRMIEDKITYSPIVCLSLELLKVFMRKKPSDGFVPATISAYVLKPLTEILLSSSDDAVTQLSSDCLVYLIQNSPSQEISPHLPMIISTLEKLLSLETSDSGAMNVGSLVVVVLEKFSLELQDLYPKILEAATRKFIEAQNISTAENLVFLFCYLISINPREAINFLSSFNIGGTGSNALSAVLPKWLEAFEVVRGDKRIKENIKALSILFFQSDERIASLMVNGDLIPYAGDLIVTRSMAKSMPQEYTKVTAYEKLVKVFVAELEFQSKERNLEKYIPTGVENYGEMSGREGGDQDGEDDGDWEDVDGALEFERLQRHLDDDSGIASDEYEEEDGNPTDESGDEDEEVYDSEGKSHRKSQVREPSVRDLLTSFFREAAAKNINNFQEIYGRLSDHEKEVLSENLL